MPVIGNLFSGGSAPYTKIQRITATYPASAPQSPGTNSNAYTVPANTVAKIKLDYYAALTGASLILTTQIVALHSVAPSASGVVPVHTSAIIGPSNKIAFEFSPSDIFDPSSSFTSPSSVGGGSFPATTSTSLFKQGKYDPLTQEITLYEGEILQFNVGATVAGTISISFIVKEQYVAP